MNVGLFLYTYVNRIYLFTNERQRHKQSKIISDPCHFLAVI